jgi:hypothetical protein
VRPPAPVLSQIDKNSRRKILLKCFTSSALRPELERGLRFTGSVLAPTIPPKNYGLENSTLFPSSPPRPYVLASRTRIEEPSAARSTKNYNHSNLAQEQEQELREGQEGKEEEAALPERTAPEVEMAASCCEPLAPPRVVGRCAATAVEAELRRVVVEVELRHITVEADSCRLQPRPLSPSPAAAAAFTVCAAVFALGHECSLLLSRCSR